jgi:transcriptional regulatory protein RtcR
LGADQESHSNFQLIGGTNRDLRQRVAEGRFRDDLLARINLWTFTLPSLRERPEDIEPNIEYELDRFAARSNRQVRFSREAGERYIEFAGSPRALWSANFRDLAASITRMATLAIGQDQRRDSRAGGRPPPRLLGRAAARRRCARR